MLLVAQNFAVSVMLWTCLLLRHVCHPYNVEYGLQVSAPEVEGSSLSLNSLPNTSRASAQARSSLHVQVSTCISKVFDVVLSGSMGGGLNGVC